MQLSGPSPHVEIKHGSLTGILPECKTRAYSNSYKLQREGAEFRPAAEHLGVFPQCVSLAKQFLWNYYGLLMPDITIAMQIFFLTHVYDESGNQVKLRSVRNGTSEKPIKNSMIIYRPRNGNAVGHIGVIVDVSNDRVYVADQNRFNHFWGDDGFAASFPLEFDPIRRIWTIIDEHESVIGWTFPVLPDTPQEKKRIENHRNLLVISENPKRFIKANEEVEVFRPIPEVMRKNFPEYHTDLLRFAWWNSLLEFAPPENPFIPTYLYYLSKLMRPVGTLLEWILF